MTAYRFCRTDDIPLLVEALNHCWLPSVPAEPPMTPAAFKRMIRDLQVWCSSCMIAFSGPEPVGVLIGAKRPSATLVHRIAVRPEHRRQGHGRHLLSSLASKLAILGPPRIVAEVPGSDGPAHALFRSCGYAEESVLTDYALAPGTRPTPRDADASAGRGLGWSRANGAESGDGGGLGARRSGDAGFVIPVTVDDLLANGLLGDEDPQLPWSRAAATLAARRDGIEGFAIACDERIEACLLVAPTAPEDAGDPCAGTEIVALRSFAERDGWAGLRVLLDLLSERFAGPFRFPKVHPDEIPGSHLEDLGFEREGAHILYAARAQAA